MAALLARRERDGLSLRRLAEESQIPIGTLAWWSWRLRQTERRSHDSGPAAFVEVVAAATSSATKIAVVLDNDTRVEVEAGFDPELLRSVVRALRPC